MSPPRPASLRDRTADAKATPEAERAAADVARETEAEQTTRDALRPAEEQAPSTTAPVTQRAAAVGGAAHAQATKALTTGKESGKGSIIGGLINFVRGNKDTTPETRTEGETFRPDVHRDGTLTLFKGAKDTIVKDDAGNVLACIQPGTYGRGRFVIGEDAFAPNDKKQPILKLTIDGQPRELRLSRANEFRSQDGKDILTLDSKGQVLRFEHVDVAIPPWATKAEVNALLFSEDALVRAFGGEIADVKPSSASVRRRSDFMHPDYFPEDGSKAGSFTYRPNGKYTGRVFIGYIYDGAPRFMGRGAELELTGRLRDDFMRWAHG